MENFFNIKVLSLGISLFVMSIEDIKHKSVPVWQLWVMGVLCLGIQGYFTYINNLNLVEILSGAIPGVVIVILSCTLKCFGTADGVIMIIIGICIGFINSIVILCSSLVIMSVVSIVGMIGKKISLKYQMPFIPFVFLGFLEVVYCRLNV